jgi:CheY-like chemotaxis protein
VPPDEGWRSLVEDLPGVLWEMDPASMRFVKVSEALVEREGLTAEMWEPGGVFLSSRIREADMPAMKAFYQLAMGGGPARSCDYESRNAAGEMVWLRDTVVMARDNKDQTPRLRGLTVNITESRRRDQFLMQKARVEALERIAGGIIHDCNNLLMIMGGYGEELLHGLPIQDPLRVNVQEILNAADRLTKITGRLSVLTAEGPEGMEEVVVDEIVGLVAGQVRAALPAAVTMERRLGAGRSTTHCHPARLQAALHTVCARAVDAMYKGGTLTVETEIGQIVSAVAGDAESPKPGPAIVIRISDAGLAMRDEDTQTLFEPAAGEPAPLHNFTPLLQIVRRAGGILRVSSGNETGTCFTITLPASAVVMMPDGHSAATVALGTVLVTEDETAIRSLIQKVLERTGYRVIATGSGQEALETAAAHQGAIDLLVTDVKMPGIDGFELANRLHKARPETKILLMSGYTGKASIEPGTVPEGSEFLGKPFTISELLSRVRGLLGGASAATA